MKEEETESDNEETTEIASNPFAACFETPNKKRSSKKYKSCYGELFKVSPMAHVNYQAYSVGKGNKNKDLTFWTLASL